jgi:hypothetical protein
VILALSLSLVHALSPTCAAPGCNSVASDASFNTAARSYAISSDTSGSFNTAAGYGALRSDTTGTGTGTTASGLTKKRSCIAQILSGIRASRERRPGIGAQAVADSQELNGAG